MDKLLQFQTKVEAIKKDSTNPFFKSNYFDINSLLAEIKPLLNELGIILLQPLTETMGDRPALRTILIDSETGKELINTQVPLPDLQDPQKLGSAITYFRRYSLQSLLALQAEDDDGNKASIITPRATQAPVSVPKPKDDKLAVKKEIIRLCDNLDTTLSENGKYKEFVRDTCGVELEEKNFDFVIKALKELN